MNLIVGIFLIVSFFVSCCRARTFPVCSNAITDVQGEIDVQATLYNCSQNIRGSMFPPSYFGNNVQGVYTGPTVVNISSSINTLITVDDVNAQVVLDIYFRMYWKDPRLNLPEELWGSMNPVVATYEGLEITPYARSQNALMIWQPDIQIMEAVQVTTAAELMHLFKDGGIFWSRHLLVTLTQAQMDLHKYPNDDQLFQMTFQSFSYSDDFVVLAPLSGKGFVSLNTIPSRPGVSALSLNRLWTYNNFDSTKISASSSIFFHKSRRFSTVTLNLNFSRQNFGIILRMVLPVAIFMMVVALTFWANIDKRIDITVQMLLVVSSLYFVIGQIIPFVGYFTTFDLFITIFFAILGVTIALHFIIYQLENVKIKYPVALLISEGLVFWSRVLALPLSLLVVYTFFPDPPDFFKIPMMLIACLVLFCALLGFHKLRRISYFVLCKMRYLRETREYKYVMKQQKNKDKETETNYEHGKESSKENKIMKILKDHNSNVIFLPSAMTLQDQNLKRAQAKEQVQGHSSLRDVEIKIKKAAAGNKDKEVDDHPSLFTHTASSSTDLLQHPPPMMALTTDTLANHNEKLCVTSNSAKPNNSPKKSVVEELLVTLLQVQGKKKWKAPDEVSDVETIDTAVEHHQTVAHKPGKMKADEDIAYDLLINQDHLYKHRVENLLVTLCQGVDCCEYHAQLQSLMKDQARQDKDQEIEEEEEEDETLRPRKEENTDKETHWQFLSAFCVPCDYLTPVKTNITDQAMDTKGSNESTGQFNRFPTVQNDVENAGPLEIAAPVGINSNPSLQEVYPRHLSSSLPSQFPILRINTSFDYFGDGYENGMPPEAPEDTTYESYHR